MILSVSSLENSTPQSVRSVLNINPINDRNVYCKGKINSFAEHNALRDL